MKKLPAVSGGAQSHGLLQLPAGITVEGVADSPVVSGGAHGLLQLPAGITVVGVVTADSPAVSSGAHGFLQLPAGLCHP